MCVVTISLSSAGAPVSDLEVVEFGFQLLDRTVCHFKIFVKTITLSNELK